MSRIAVVILNYNGKELLQKFLPSVVQFSKEARVLVADNNSSDGSIDFLKSEFPDIEVIEIKSNLGFCGGYNYALARVDADYFVLLNSDVEVTPGWLEPLLQLFDNPLVGAAQPKILSYREKEKFEYAGAGGGFIDKLGYPFCRGRIFHTIETDRHQYDEPAPVFWASGACLLIRASLFKKMGGFEERFFAHMEEIDLCWRLQRSGYKVMYQGASTVYHVGGATLAKTNPRKTYYNFRNGLMLLLRNLSPTQLLVRIPLRLVLDWVAGLQFLISGKPLDFMAIWKAHFYILTRFYPIMRERSAIKQSIPSFQVPGIYSGFIVLDYFLREKKRFPDLKI